MGQSKKVLLSFDIEEFDVPAEYGIYLPFEEQIRFSAEGTQRILNILKVHSIPATFFTTVTFAQHARPIIDQILSAGHELASHGWFHSKFEISHLSKSRIALKDMFGVEVSGFRMARMMDVQAAAVRDSGYTYNSSLNPVYLPGRYNNFSQPRTIFESKGLVQVPASATPLIRVPLFWLSFHHMPGWLYRASVARTMSADGYVNIYFHPWEFTKLSDVGLPWIITRNSGEAMERRFADLLSWMKARGYAFNTIREFVKNQKGLH